MDKPPTPSKEEAAAFKNLIESTSKQNWGDDTILALIKITLPYYEADDKDDWFYQATDKDVARLALKFRALLEVQRVYIEKEAEERGFQKGMKMSGDIGASDTKWIEERERLAYEKGLQDEGWDCHIHVEQEKKEAYEHGFNDGSEENEKLWTLGNKLSEHDQAIESRARAEQLKEIIIILDEPLNTGDASHDPYEQGGIAAHNKLRDKVLESLKLKLDTNET